MSVFAFLRVSTERQTLDNQRLEILTWANKSGVIIDEFVEIQVSTRKKLLDAMLEDLFGRAREGDTIIVAELSRLARSIRQLLMLVNRAMERGLTLVSLKEGLRLTCANQHDVQTKVMVTLFSLLYEVERDMISERTKRGLDRPRASGKKLGRPRGAGGDSKLDDHRAAVAELLALGCPFTVIARKFGCHRTTVARFAESQALQSVAPAQN